MRKKLFLAVACTVITITGGISMSAASMAYVAAVSDDGRGAKEQTETDVKAIFAEDPVSCVNVLHPYPAPEKIIDTPAPKGYKPFYVSHYGRHGSRYHYTEKNIFPVVAVMDSLAAHSLLTEEGQSVRADLQKIAAQHEGLVGYLTHRGAAEHQAIARNLYSRCPEIFNQKGRREIYCVSTPVQRCIQSMANFCLQLGRENPDLRMTMDAGERYRNYLNNHDGATLGPRGRDRQIADSIMAAHIDISRIMNTWFTNPSEAKKYMSGRNPRRFIADVVKGGGIGPCLDEDPGIFRHFTLDELYAVWCYDTVTHYNSMCASVENGRGRDVIGQRILRDMLDKADAAIAGNDHAADLRFGHDTGLAPLLSLLQVEGLEGTKKLADSINCWYGFRQMPMGSNIQMIFYRNKKGEILVKLLRNERETVIPALKTVTGPYYDWQTLRNYFVSLLDE